MKKIVSLLISIIIVFNILPLSSLQVAADSSESGQQTYEDVWDGKIALGFDSGNGSENDPYIIRTGAQLAYLAQQTNIGINYDNNYFELLNDIDLNNIPWTPIGNSSYNQSRNDTEDQLINSVVNGNRFSGNFNGNGHTIKNLKFSEDYNKNHLGFFDICDGNISNLSISVPKISIKSKSTAKYVRIFGGIVGLQYGGTVNNCSFSGNIIGYDFSCGAIIGLAVDTVIQNCTFSGSMSLSGNSSKGYSSYRVRAGGMIGKGYRIVIVGCENFASISTDDVSKYSVSGIIVFVSGGGKISGCNNYGELNGDESVAGIVVSLSAPSDDADKSEVRNCKNYGKCTSYQLDAGGIVNQIGRGTISDCVNYGDIYSKYVSAGILMYFVYGDKALIAKCCNYGKITAELDYAGGICGQGITTLTIQDCYNAGAIEIISGDQYHGSGGILGGWHPAYKYSDSIPTVKNCYNIGKIITNKKSAAICASKYCRGSNCYYLDNNSRGVYSTADFEATKLTEKQMKYASNFEGFDFKNIWGIDSNINNGYPYLKDAPPNKMLDTSFIDYSKSKSRLKYPIYNKESFAKLLQSWAENSEVSNAFSVYLKNGYTYEDLLDLTIDLPALSNEGTGFAIKGETRVKDLMAYLLFADNVKKFMSDVEFNVKSKISEEKEAEAYKYFYEQLMEFNLQLNYFQKQLNGIDAFNQTLTALLIAKTAMEIIDEVEITFKSGEKKYLIYGTDEYNDTIVSLDYEDVKSTIKFKSYSYITDLYKTSVDESYENYDSLQYYLLSGGDKTYLNETYQDVLDGYSNIIDNCKFVIKGEWGFDSVVDIGLKNIEYFTKRSSSPVYDQVKEIKEIWDNGKKGYNLLKSIATYSPFGIINATYSLTNEYIDKVKEVYKNVEKTEFGWYALTYYYLEKNNPKLLNALIDPKTGSAEFGIDRVVMNGIPYDRNDVIQKSITEYWNNSAYLQHTYTPDDETRLYMLNSCNTLNRIRDMDITSYSNSLLEYIVANLGLEHNIADQYANVKAYSENSSLGTVSKSVNGVKTIVSAVANSNSTFVGWYDVSTGERVSAEHEYQIDSFENVTLSARFTSTVNATIAADAKILSQSSDMEVPLGATSEALFINASSPDGGNITIEWYKNSKNSNRDGEAVGSGTTYIPSTDVSGTIYYYACISNVLTKNGITTSSMIRSSPIKVSVLAPTISGIEILSLPNKTIYALGEEFSSNGLSVAFKFSDGSQSTLTEYNLIYDDFSTVGIKKVTVSYWGFTQQFEVEVATRKQGTLSETVSWDLDFITGELIISGTGTIPSSAYSQMSSYRQYIKSLTIEEGITAIGMDSFAYLTKLETVYLPTTLTTIDRFAFEDCTSLTQISFPENLAYIGDYAFGWCTKLSNIVFNKELKNVGRNAFVSTAWYNNQEDGFVYINNILYKYKGSCPEEIEIRSNTETIGYSAFNNCTSLKKIKLPNTVTNIDSYAFYGCSGLEKIIIPDSVKTIGTNAFYNCSSLIIYCDFGSIVAEYAESQSINHMIFGDLSLDKTLNSADLVLMRKYLLDTTTEIGVEDINHDGKSNIVDLVRLKKCMAGINF